MRNWVLHHMHFMIAVDCLLHLTIMLLCFLAAYYMVSFVKLTWTHPRATTVTKTISLFTIPIMGYMLIVSQWSFYDCASHYAEWWSR